VESSRVDWIVERLRRGQSVALTGDRSGTAPRGTVAAIERERSALGRTTVWIDLDGAESGAELGGRIVEGCMQHLDPGDLGDLLEQLPSRGRIDLEAFAELLMLPERIASASGRRVVAILEGFHQVERVIGFSGLGAVRDALLLRARVSYLFVGPRRLQALFGRPDMPLYGLAEVVSVEGGGAIGGARPGAGRPAARGDGRRADRPPDPVAGVEAPSDDPLAAALLSWAEAPPKPEPGPAREREPWEWLLEREAAEREWFERLERPERDGDDDDRWWRRGRRRRR
jgi:hypothetical protein